MRSCVSVLSSLGVLAQVCLAQTVSVGLAGGGRATDDLTEPGATSVSKRYVIGPAAEIGLRFGLGLEANALYRREGYETVFWNFANSISSSERANSWEFPVLVKYRLPVRGIQPFLEAGYAPRVIRGSITSDTVQVFPVALPAQHSVQSTYWPTSHGVVAGGGIQFGISRLRFAPTLRYTHWNNIAISGGYVDGPGWRSTQDQLDVLVGIAWTIPGKTR